MINSCRHEVEEHGRIFVVNWLLGTICNYRCTYCNETLYAGQTRWIDIESCERVVDAVFRRCEESGRTPYFEFTGGEVTLYRPLPRLLGHIKSKGGRVGIITNGSGKTEIMDQVIPHIDHICMSYHARYAKDEPFLALARRCALETTCHVNVMADPGQWERIAAIVDALAKVEGITLSVQPLLQKLGTDGRHMAYGEDQRRQLEEWEGRAGNVAKAGAFVYRGRMAFDDPGETLSIPQIMNRRLNRFKGWVCWAGVESIAIDEKGSVYNGWCKQECYGSIFDEKIPLPSAPVLCRRESCHCNIDILSSKKIGPDAPAGERDYGGRYRESYGEGFKAWDLTPHFPVSQTAVLEFRAVSGGLLARVAEAKPTIRVRVEYEEGGGISTGSFETALMPMTGCVVQLGERQDGEKVLRSVRIEGCEPGILAGVKLGRITSRG